MTIFKRRQRPVLVLLVKEPKIGTVKTRLAKETGTFIATSWYRNQIATTINRLHNVPCWDFILGVTPKRAALEGKVKIWPSQISRFDQGRGQLGNRFFKIARDIQSRPIIFIGSDIPNIRISHIIKALKILSSNDVIFGPSPDGGFWLIGLNHPQKINSRHFANVRWSTGFALQDCLTLLSGIKVGFTDTLCDVDTIEDVRNVQKPIIRYH